MKVLIKSREISLTKTELKMLTFFLQNPKQILSKTQILENVFDLEGDFVDENTIAVNIRRLCEKIEDNPDVYKRQLLRMLMTISKRSSRHVLKIICRNTMNRQ